MEGKLKKLKETPNTPDFSKAVILSLEVINLNGSPCKIDMTNPNATLVLKPEGFDVVDRNTGEKIRK